ncbi:hypothetical protein EAY64_02540 [Aquitalea palustris]|uniref:Uncharacterized protein n=1 Tax=Aquitalea palustris TaxID=2480983 RepID=A0A454JML9_9NEIS|nr:hypothetical protein EAY64_02540 [Aquitalea palustris]
MQASIDNVFQHSQTARQAMAERMRDRAWGGQEVVRESAQAGLWHRAVLNVRPGMLAGKQTR